MSTVPRVSPEVVARAQRGDTEAFGQVYTAYQPLIFAYCRGLVHSRERAEELAQDTWVHALRAIHRTVDHGPLCVSGWLHRIAHNLCISELRRRARIHFDSLEAGMEEPDAAPSPILAAETAETESEVDEMLAALPPAEAAALRMRHQDGATIALIAGTLNVSKHRVRELLTSGTARCVAYQDKLLAPEVV